MRIEQFPSQLLEKAVGEMSKLPAVGRKTALRLVLHLLRKDASQTHSLAQALLDLREVLSSLSQYQRHRRVRDLHTSPPR